MRPLLIGLAMVSLVAGGCARVKAGHDDSRYLSRGEAIQRANEEEGRPEEASAITAELRSGRPWPEASEQVWVVDYHCVPVPIFGPMDRVGPSFDIADWGVVIDSETGAFIVAGSSGDPKEHCPHG